MEKLRPGGALCVIVPAGWMNAGNADFLRERLASELTLRELYLFGSYRLFASDQGPAPTPTVESAILVATKGPAPKGHKLRVVALEDERLLADRSRADLLAEMARRSRRSGRRGGVLSHLLPQALLEADYPWPVKFPGDGIHMRAVSHLLTALEDHSTAVEIMSKAWSVFTGVETAADAYTERIRKTLPADVRRAVDQTGAVVGAPIMELPSSVATTRPWAAHEDLVAWSPEPTAILYGAVDELDVVAYLRLEGAPRRQRTFLTPSSLGVRFWRVERRFGGTVASGGRPHGRGATRT